ncbi:MAG: TetR/AcrR family transcriptional regulator [Rhizomicrobium sp.]|jgi:AcrR family transcriptional regulator
MPKISAQKLKDRYDSILDAAQQAFVENGFEASSITQIANAADVSEGLIYRYFENKHDLLLRMLEAFYARFVMKIQSVVASEGDFETRLRVMTRAHLQAYVEDADICRLFIAEVRSSNPNSHPDTQAIDKRYGMMLMRFVQNGIREGSIRSELDPRLVRDLFWGVLENVARRHLNGRMPLDVDVMSESICDVLLSGVENKGVTSSRSSAGRNKSKRRNGRSKA